MTSVEKVEANRANAQWSTGPKDTSTTRHNARKHGILSSQLLVEPDQEQAFSALKEGMVERYVPEGVLEESLVDVMATALWRWRRVIALERDATQFLNESPYRSKPAQMPGPDDMARVQRYEAHLSRQFFNALHELQRLQAFRLGKEAKVPEAVDVSMEVG